jgi:GT2 family glycosyltransferase
MINSSIVNNALDTPVLFIVFNRPDTTSRVFEAIRKAKPPRLYVAADGPRPDRMNDSEQITKVRKIATAVDWPCEVKTLFREKNLGCGLAVSQGITWFFEHEDQGIVLEDDCLPNLSFFWFCEELLEYHKSNENVLFCNRSNT